MECQEEDESHIVPGEPVPDILYLIGGGTGSAFMTLEILHPGTLLPTLSFKQSIVGVSHFLILWPTGLLG